MNTVIDILAGETYWLTHLCIWTKFKNLSGRRRFLLRQFYALDNEQGLDSEYNAPSSVGIFGRKEHRRRTSHESRLASMVVVDCQVQKWQVAIGSIRSLPYATITGVVLRPLAITDALYTYPRHFFVAIWASVCRLCVAEDVRLILIKLRLATTELPYVVFSAACSPSDIET